jgi:glycosyltransferase involved in cell wall biosynthesis
MKLCAIYNVWNDWDWLEISCERIWPLVDGIIVIASEKSNHGEISPIPYEWIGKVILREPFLHNPMYAETDKRNYGLSIARRAGYTHFVMMDADELYVPEEFKAAKKLFEDTELQGLVCRSQVYFGSPKLTIGLDTTLVPFIHKITPTLKHEFNRNYPFAWEGKAIRIDPTRSLNINSGVKMCDVTMHHYSWVRKDYEKKIRNSTARANLDRSTIREDLRLAKDGYFVKFYGKSLVRAQVEFNIPEFNVSDT